MLEYVAERELGDGTILRLGTWVSDVVRPGQRMYQIELTDGGLTIGFPTDFENYTENQIRCIYEFVKSREHLEKLIGGAG